MAINIQNLYEYPKPIKALLDDANRVVLAEFEDIDSIDVINGGTGSNNAYGARRNLELIRFDEYNDYTPMPDIPPESSIIAKYNGNMYYAANGNWHNFHKILIESQIAGHTTLNDVTQLVLGDGFLVEQLEHNKLKLSVEVKYNLVDLKDVQLSEEGLTNPSMLMWSPDYQKFIPLIIDPSKLLNNSFLMLDDVDLPSLEETDTEVLVDVMYSNIEQKVKFAVRIDRLTQLVDVELNTDGPLVFQDGRTTTTQLFLTEWMPKYLNQLQLLAEHKMSEGTTTRHHVVFNTLDNTYELAEPSGHLKVKLYDGGEDFIPLTFTT